MKKGSEQALTKSLHRHLQSLRSIVPSRPNSRGRSSVIFDALDYIEEMQQHIRVLSSEIHAMSPPLSMTPSHPSVLSRARQPTNMLNTTGRLSREDRVEVIAKETGLDIHISCQKRPGLLVAIMEALERSGLMYSKMDLQCRGRLEFDAYGAQNSEGRVIEAEAVKKILVRTITEQRNGDGA